MATSSFFKEFVISDPESIASVKASIDSPTKVAITKQDWAQSEHEGLEALGRLLKKLERVKAP